MQNIRRIEDNISVGTLFPFIHSSYTHSLALHLEYVVDIINAKNI